MIGVGIMGYGTVGSGVAEVLSMNAASITQKAGCQIEVKKILDLRDFPGDPNEGKLTKDFQDILKDESIQIVVETMGGLHPAYEFVKQALEADKNVVTSNKLLVAEKGDELLQIAKEHQRNFFFEASVGGGIPILWPLHECLAANEVTEIAGILNGTTNFMLNKMIEEKMTFDDALALAQKLGYAERDPSADIDGHDACRKICILAALAFGNHIYPQDVYCEGLRNVTLEDVATAAAMDSVIKLIGHAKKCDDGRVAIGVYPMVLKQQCLLSHVSDVFNAVQVKGNAVGDVMFYGPGAGKLPTASAVVGDVIDAAKHVSMNKSPVWAPAKEGSIVPQENVESAFVLRFSCDCDVTPAVHAIFGDVQYVYREGATANELAFVTPVLSEKVLQEKIKQLAGAPLISSLRFGTL